MGGPKCLGKSCIDFRGEKIKVCGQTLINWYRHNGCTYKIQPWRTSCYLTGEEKHAQQEDFCFKLLGHWRRGDEVLFLDETTQYSDGGNLRTWQRKDQAIYIY